MIIIQKDERNHRVEFSIRVNFAIQRVMQPTFAQMSFCSGLGSPQWFSLPTFSGRSADEICSGLIAAAGPIDVRARLVDIRVERVENVGKKRNGRVRGVDVRKGKLLAGDSGRKIAEVIDLRRAIYQRGSREDGRGTSASVCANTLVYVYGSMPMCGEVERVKGGEFSCDSQSVSTRGMRTKTLKS